MSHTPGPWGLGRKTKTKVCISGPSWSEFAKVVVRMKYSEDACPEGYANARLIAAAPDLLKACELAFAFDWKSGEGCSEMSAALGDAIKKAKGE